MPRLEHHTGRGLPVFRVAQDEAVFRGISGQPLVGAGRIKAVITGRVVRTEDIRRIAGAVIIAFRRRLDICRKAGGFFLGFALFQILLLLRLIGRAAGICVLIACRQHQCNAVLGRSRSHFLVGCSCFGFQLDTAGFIGIGKGRRGFLGKRQIGVHQHKALIVSIKAIAGAIVAGRIKALRPCKHGVHLWQQPEDAFGHKRHNGGADENENGPIAGQPQPLAALPLSAGQAGLCSISISRFHGALQLLLQNLQRTAPHRYSVYYTPLCILCKRRKCKISMTEKTPSVCSHARIHLPQ